MKVTAKNSYVTFVPENTNDVYWLGMISQKLSHEAKWAPADESIGCGLMEFKQMSIHIDVLINYLADSDRR